MAANFSGEYTGGKTASVTIELQACVNAKASLHEHHEPADKSQIETLPLEAEVGFVRNEEVEPANHPDRRLDIKPKSPLTDLAVYECGNTLETYTLEGSVIAKVRPFDKVTNVSASRSRSQTHPAPEIVPGRAEDTLTTTIMSGNHHGNPLRRR